MNKGKGERVGGGRYRWEEYDGYYLSLEPQRSQAWKDLRFMRTTATAFYGVTNSSFDSPEDTADYLCGLKEKTFTPEALARMELGNQAEEPVRLHYELKHETKVEEVGLAVPKDDFAIGASSDGLTESGGLIEIKTTATMYPPIQQYLDEKKAGHRFPKGYVEHIWSSHYVQMQGQMAILGAPWCDYLVLSLSDERIFEQRIYYEANFWAELHPQLRDFDRDFIQPRRALTARTRIDPTDRRSQLISR